MKNKINDAWKIAGGAFLGAFVSKYVDISLGFHFPINVIGLIITSIIIIIIARYMIVD